MEYIEYLQERNSELASKLSEMKENYESKLFNRHFRNYHTSLVDEILVRWSMVDLLSKLTIISLEIIIKY